MKVYKLKIKEGDESGVEYVALVDEPAIERYFLAFEKAKHLFQISDQEKRIVKGPLMVADMPIYRRDLERGEYYVLFDKETILQVVQKFFKKGFQLNVNQMHDPKKRVDGVYMYESFIIDKDAGLLAPKGFDDLTDGSWFGTFKVENDEVWEQIKKQEFRGFSVEGMFEMEEEPTEIENSIIQIINELCSQTRFD